MKKIIFWLLITLCLAKSLGAEVDDVVIADPNGKVLATVCSGAVHGRVGAFIKKHKIALFCTLGGIVVVVGTVSGFLRHLEKLIKAQSRQNAIALGCIEAMRPPVIPCCAPNDLNHTLPETYKFENSPTV